ncbi:hypothetical protein DESC_820036 [Desulfosarcina cetonica]|nr:hypothetical protein DESC_820036 [Desulfosarcina cetonica]
MLETSFYSLISLKSYNDWLWDRVLLRSHTNQWLSGSIPIWLLIIAHIH